MKRSIKWYNTEGGNLMPWYGHVRSGADIHHVGQRKEYEQPVNSMTAREWVESGKAAEYWDGDPDDEEIQDYYASLPNDADTMVEAKTGTPAQKRGFSVIGRAPSLKVLPHANEDGTYKRDAERLNDVVDVMERGEPWHSYIVKSDATLEDDPEYQKEEAAERRRVLQGKGDDRATEHEMIKDFPEEFRVLDAEPEGLIKDLYGKDSDGFKSSNPTEKDIKIIDRKRSLLRGEIVERLGQEGLVWPEMTMEERHAWLDKHDDLKRKVTEFKRNARASQLSPYIISKLMGKDPLQRGLDINNTDAVDHVEGIRRVSNEMLRDPEGWNSDERLKNIQKVVGDVR